MDKKLHVLVIEDNQPDAEINIRLLRNAGYEVYFERVESAAEFMASLKSRTWDLILSDYSMPLFTVQEALEIYYAFGLDIPFIVISGLIGEEKAVELINAGVHDYLMKDNLVRFVPVVERELRDVNHQRELIKLSKALATSEAKYKSYVENAPDVVFVADITGRYIEVNEAACRITGYTREELLEMSVTDMITETSLALGQEKFSELIQRGSLRADFEVRHKDGSVLWLALDAVQISDTHFLGFMKDVTDRKNAILEAMKAREQLQQLNKYLMDARENERAKVALEIHDELGQALTSIKIDLNWVLEHIGDTAKSTRKIGQIIEMTNDTIKKVQRISSELRPGLLDDLGLATAIEWYSGEFEQRTGIKCELMLEDVNEGDQRTNLALFRILQEALTNVIRHASAKTVWINLEYNPEGITMVIRDDGLGISPEKISSGNSLGLIGMRERARQLDGTVEFSNEMLQGTQIITTIPNLKTTDSYENPDCR